MTNESILLIVSVSAAALSLLSTAWGLTRELSVKDEQQKKRLTRAGQIAISLAVGSAILATTSLGMRELIDRQKKAEAKRGAEDAKHEKVRAALDEQRWRSFNDRQQQVLAKLGIDETAKQGGLVVTNQQLLAAIERQRDQTLAASSRLFQSAQSQSIVRQVKPIGSLNVTMRFGGLTAAQFAELEKGEAWVKTLPERDDDYDSRFDGANRYADILLPLLRQFVGKSEETGGDEDREVILAVDLDGTGAWLLPLGKTAKDKARGLVVTDAYLYEVSKPYGDLSKVKQEIDPCVFPGIDLDKATLTATIYWDVPAGCLPIALQRSAQPIPNPQLSENLGVLLFRGGSSLFPISPTDTKEMDVETWNQCWRPASEPTGKRYIQIDVRTNTAIRLGKRLLERGTTDMRTPFNKYDGATRVGSCNFFG